MHQAQLLVFTTSLQKKITWKIGDNQLASLGALSC